MKKITYIIAGFSALFCSCSILDIEPASEWGGTSMPTEQSHIEAILNGGYQRLCSALQSGFVYYGDARADVYYTNSTSAVTADKIVRSNLEINLSQASWTNFYQVVKQANLNIYYIPRMVSEGTLDAANVNDLLGQSYCLRAMAYFWIVRIWGDAPLVTVPVFSANDDFDMPRSPVDDVFVQIHKDLDSAYVYLTDPASSKYRKSVTRFTRPASQALKAQVYMWQKEYALALKELNDVIDKGGYSLEKLYDASLEAADTDNFRNEIAKTGFSKMFNAEQSSGSTESIFELSFSTSDGDTNNAFDSFWTATTATFVVREDFVNFLKENTADMRYYASVTRKASNGKTRCKKMVMNYTRGDARNIILMRLGDMLLLRAEARLGLVEGDALSQAQADEIMADINAIMVRAAGPDAEMFYDKDGEGYKDWSKEEFVGLLKSERRKELAFEGHRWFDLVRWGDVNNALGAMEPAVDATYVFDTGGFTIDERAIVWPIHINEIRRSKYIEQNEYYK